MSGAIDIRTTDDGRVQARRKDGRPLTPEDRTRAKRLIEQVSLPPRAWVAEEVHSEAGDLRAVKICSGLLEDHLWLIIDRSFLPTDHLAR